MDQFQKLPSVFVFADHSCQRDLASECAQVQRHVTRSARSAAFVVEPDDWDGRLRRDPLDCPPEIPIQHQVSHHQHAVIVKTPLNGFENAMEVLKHAYSKSAATANTFGSAFSETDFKRTWTTRSCWSADKSGNIGNDRISGATFSATGKSPDL